MSTFSQIGHVPSLAIPGATKPANSFPKLTLSPPTQSGYYLHCYSLLGLPQPYLYFDDAPGGLGFAWLAGIYPTFFPTGD